MSDYALVVGIETYQADCAPPLQGPALDALRFALWLAKTGVPPQNILLFHNKSNAWNGDLENKFESVLLELQARNVRLRGEPTWAAIEKAWREELLEGPENKGTLWLYWSGHGVAFSEDREALLCSDMHYRDPAFVYLSELTQSFLSQEYSRFQTQRLIVDACSEQRSYDALEVKAVREPTRFKEVLGSDQTVWNAVAMGETARAEEGGSLFTRVLLGKLEGLARWPADIEAFYREIDKAIEDIAEDPTKRPRLRIKSRYYENGFLQDGDHRVAECREILKALAASKVPYEKYQPLYQRTVGNLAPDDRMSHASTLTAMIQVLLDLHPEVQFGGVSRAMAEFLARAVRDFPADTGPVRDWISRRIPAGGLATVEAALRKERPDLALAIMLMEAPSADGFPVQMSACLADAGFSRLVRQWEVCESRELEDLKAKVHDILFDARSLGVKQNVKLTVHIYANPPLLALPFHALPVNPASKKDNRVFSQFDPLVLRSRARLRRDDILYNMEAWQEKLKALRSRQGSEISFHPALCWKDTIQDEFATVDGLLLIRDVVGSVRSEQELLEAALQCGLPLVSWRVEPPDSWDDFEEKLKNAFKKFGNISESPQKFRDVRNTEEWARQTALLWDDDDNEPLRTLLGEEPSSI